MNGDHAEGGSGPWEQQQWEDSGSLGEFPQTPESSAEQNAVSAVQNTSNSGVSKKDLGELGTSPAEVDRMDKLEDVLAEVLEEFDEPAITRRRSEAFGAHSPMAKAWERSSSRKFKVHAETRED